MNKRLALLFALCFTVSCGESQPKPNSKKIEAPVSKTAEPRKPKSWQEVIPEIISDPVDTEADGSIVKVKIKNAAPWKPDRFELLAIELGKKLYNAQSPFSVVAVQAFGDDQSQLKATVYSVDLVAHLKREISQAELLRRMQLETVETPASVKGKVKAARNEGRLEDALPLLEKWIQLEPDSIAALSLFGNVQRDLKKYWEAIPVYKKIAEAEPASPFAFHNLGFAYDKVGSFEDSLMFYRKALALKPDSTIQLQMAEVSRKNGDLNGALNLIARIKSEQTSSDALLIEGNIQRDLKKYAPARQAYIEAQKLNPADLKILFNLIALDLETKKLEDARQNFLELKSKDPLLAGEFNGISAFQEESLSE